MLATVGSAWAAGPSIHRISMTPRSDGLGYVLRFHTTGQIHAYSEPRVLPDGRQEMILFNTALASSYQPPELSGPLHALEAVVQRGHLHVRFQLRKGDAVDLVAYRDRASTDLLLALTLTNPPVAEASAPTGAPETAPAERRGQPDARPATPVPVRPVAAEAARQQPASSTLFASASERWRLDTVVIDAGHGGHDPGNLGSGFQEKDVTLAVALKVGAYIEERLGIDVVYTRTDDRFIDLRERGHIANRAEGKLFISIHCNAHHSNAYGTETFFLGLHKTDAAQRVMEQENSVIRYEEDQDYYKKYDNQRVRQALVQSAYLRKSESLASLIEQQFEHRVSRKSRGVKQAGLYVLHGASMPAVLVELGFLTNRREAAFLTSERGQDYLASAIFRAVRTFKDTYERDLNYATEK